MAEKSLFFAVRRAFLGSADNRKDEQARRYARAYSIRPQRPFAADQGSGLRGRQSADMATRRSRIQTYTAQGGIGWGNLPKRMVQENLDSGRLMQICPMPKAVADLHQRDDCPSADNLRPVCTFTLREVADERILAAVRRQII
jgi:hypothetical protein